MANTSSAAGAGTATGQDADISPVNPSLIPQDAPDLLVIVLDTNPFAWAASATPSEQSGDALSFEQALQSVLVLCNAHLALRFENQVAVYSAGLNKSELLYSSLDAHHELQNRGSAGAVQLPPEPEEASTSDANSYQAFRAVDEEIAKRIQESQVTVSGEETDLQAWQDRPVAFSSALTKALCHIHRLSASTSTTTQYHSRILVISASSEASTQYIPIMNCIFSAQKLNIPIDVCKVFPTAEDEAATGQNGLPVLGGEEGGKGIEKGMAGESVFLQQASFLTKASYVHLKRREGLLQWLMMAFLPGPAIRKQLHLPSQEQIDLRAACFCHKRIVDIGYVCSVCLSIFCSPIPVCITCRTRFPIASLKRLMGGGGAAIPGASTSKGGPGTPAQRTAGSPAPSPLSTSGGAKKRKAAPEGVDKGRNGTPKPPGT